MPVLLERSWLLTAVVAPAALLVGAAATVSPLMTVGAVVGALVLAAAFLFPVAHLAVLLTLTAIVPYDLMNTYSLGGGSGNAGLLISDVFLLSGLTRAVAILARERLRGFEAALLLATLGILAVVVLQLLHGLRSGHAIGTAGNEARILLGFGTALIALSIVREPGGRGRLLRALLGAAILLGVAGILQWFAGASFLGSGDFGVREGVSYTSEGRGQLQGGLYSYPIVVIVGFAALAALPPGSGGARTALLVAVGLSAVGALLTFERTFWVVAVLGCAFVALRARRIQRGKVVLASITAAAIGLMLTAAFSPGTFTTARERLLSIGQYGSDNSVAYRLRESRFVAAEIREAPIDGSGLGATVYWGRPSEGVQAEDLSYSHNGYLWLAWKIGIPAAILVFGLVAMAVLMRPARNGEDPLMETITVGCQGALFALLVVNVTFPSVSALSSTPTAGVLLAFCAAGLTERFRAAAPQLVARPATA